MDLDFSFVCDYGEVSGSRLTACGIGFDAILAQRFPFLHELFFFVAQLRFDRSEVGEKQLTLRLYDPEDRVMAEIFVPLRVETPFPGEQSIARVAVALSNIVFRSEGVHHVQLDDPGGTQISRLPVRVKPALSFP